MPVTPYRLRSLSPADAETATRHPAAPLTGLFGDPDCGVHDADRADDDPICRAELFTPPRERRPR